MHLHSFPCKLIWKLCKAPELHSNDSASGPRPDTGVAAQVGLTPDPLCSRNPYLFIHRLYSQCMVRLRFSLVRTGAIVSLLFESRGSLVLGALPKEASSQPPVTVSSWGRWGSKGEGAADGDDAGVLSSE